MVHSEGTQTAQQVLRDKRGNQGDHARDTIVSVRCYPVTQVLAEPTQTAWGRYSAVSIVMVELTTEHGHVGAGEVLARFAPKAYCELIETALALRLVGQDPDDIDGLWSAMRRALSGRACGLLVEAIAGIDIALWDIRGKRLGKPLASLLAANPATHVPVYAASVNWAEDEREAQDQLAGFIERGFDRIKIKIGNPPQAAARRIEAIRAYAGDAVTLYADANWAYALDEAEYVGQALGENSYAWFEEPLDPDDEEGYEQLARRLTIPLAAGESNFTSGQARRLIEARALAYIQPNATRCGGVSETVRTARHAQSNGIAYAAHVGMSGIVCETVGLHVAAAIGPEASVECAMAPNLFKSDLADRRPGYQSARAGMLEVPTGPGLGISINWDAVRANAA